MRWLHLTDLHVGKNNEAQQTALVNLIEAITKQSEGLDFDVVLLSGDLAFSGQRSEYEKLDSLIIQPLRDLENFKNAIFVAAPGNHDLDCQVGLPVNWAHIGAARQDAFFNLDPIGTKIRSSRASNNITGCKAPMN